MVEDLIKRLRERAPNAETGDDSCLMELASDAIEQQAARITALESERDALLAAAGKEAVAWQVRRADGRIDGVPIQWENCTQELYDATLATGRYAGYENGPQCEVRALYTAPTAALEKGDGRDAWQPIETAPKDGTAIDLWVGGEFAGRRAACYWGKPGHDCGEYGHYCDSDWHDLDDGWVDDMNMPLSAIDDQEPTHWQPLPAPPAALSQKAGEQQ